MISKKLTFWGVVWLASFGVGSFLGSSLRDIHAVQSRPIVVGPLVEPKAKALTVPEQVPVKTNAPTFLSFALEDGQRLGMATVGDPSKFLLSRQWTENPQSYTFLVWSGEPGTYSVVWWIVGESSGKVTTFTVSDPEEKKPKPKPNPDPAPVVHEPSPMFVVVIEQTDVEASSRGTLLGSPTIAKYFQSKGHRWRVVNIDVTDKNGNPPEDIKTYLESARGKVLPQMWIVDNKLKTRWSGPAPTGAGSEKEFLDLLKSVGG